MESYKLDIEKLDKMQDILSNVKNLHGKTHIDIYLAIKRAIKVCKND